MTTETGKAIVLGEASDEAGAADPSQETETVVVPGAEDEGELLVAIGKEPEAEAAADDAEIEAPLDDGTPPSETIKGFRRKAREDAKALRRLEEERDAAIAGRGAPKAEEPQAVVVGEKPTFEGCEFDAAKFEAELLAWNTRTNEAAAAEERKAGTRKAAEQVYADRLTAYRTGATALKVPDFAAAEKAVDAGLNVVQQSIIIRHAKNAALLILALGRDPAKLKELGAISDPVEFGIKAAFLESEIKTVKKSGFKPETTPSGSGSGALPTGASALDKARAEGDKTGDYSAAARIKREQAQAAAKKK